MFLSVKLILRKYIFPITVLVITTYPSKAVIDNIENGFVGSTIPTNVPKKQLYQNEKQRLFNDHIRNTQAASLAWLLSIEEAANGDGKEVFNKALTLGEKMAELGDLVNEPKGRDLLANPENALLYFFLMDRINNMLFLLLGAEQKSSSVQFRNAAEHVAKNFNTKNRPTYQHYLASNPVAEREIFNKKHFAPFLLAKTLYAPSESSKGMSSIVRNHENETQITCATKGFSDFCEKDVDKKTLSQYCNGDILMWYYSMSPFIIRLFNNRIENEYNNGILNFFAKLFTKVKSAVWDNSGEIKNDPKKNDFNPKILEIDDNIRTFVNEKKYSHSFDTMQNALLQYFEQPQSVFPYVLYKLPPYKLERHHFKNEPEYQLYLLVSAPQHKLEPGCPQVDTYEMHKAFVQQYINSTLTPAIKNLEQNSKEPDFVFTNNDREYIESARQYCFAIVCAKLCESVWRKDTGEDMWPRNGNNSTFAGFTKETMDNLKYIAVLLASLQNTGGTK